MVVMAKTVKNRRKKNRRTKTVKKIKQIGGGPAYDEMDKIFENLIMHNLDEDVGVKDLIRLYPKLNNGDILKLIFQANKDFDSGRIEIFSEGLAKITFTKENIKSKYFLVRLATS